MNTGRTSQVIVFTAAAVALAGAVTEMGSHTPATPHLGMARFGRSVVMWQAMMIAMMTPAVAPWLVAYGRLVGDAQPGGSLAATLRFGSGYFTVWLGYSVAAALLQTGLTWAGGAGHLPTSRLAAGCVLIAAGGFQFTSMKAACLTHCRNPLSYLLTRWRGGPPSAFGLGIRHGAYCVGCCWLLMLTGFSVGLMHLGWMAVVTLVVTGEQILPDGARLGRLFGAALVVWGGMLVATA